MTMMLGVYDDVLKTAFEATIMAVVVVVVCLTAASEVIRLWRWRNDVLHGLIEPRASHTTEGEAALLATACSVLILCTTFVVVPATSAIVRYVHPEVSEIAAPAEENRGRP